MLHDSLVLSKFNETRRYETFDPRNQEHIKAYVSLQKYRKQHPTLRFYQEKPFLDIPSMMASKIADMFDEQTSNS